MKIVSNLGNVWQVAEMMWYVTFTDRIGCIDHIDGFTRFLRRKNVLLAFLRSNLLSEIHVDVVYVITGKCVVRVGLFHKKEEIR